AARVDIAASQDRASVLADLDARSQKRVGKIAAEEDRPIQVLAFLPNGLLLVLTASDMFAVDADSGQRRWRIDRIDGFVPATLEIGPEGLYVSTDGRTVTHFDSDTGRRKWTTPDIGTA